MSAQAPRHRGFIAPGLTLTSASSASGIALYYGHVQPWVAALLVSMGFALALVQTVIPQASEDRVKVWSLVIGHLRLRFTHRPSVLSPSSAPTAVVEVDPRKDLGDALRAHRVARKMKISEAANAIGCSESKVSRLERGVVSPKENDIGKLVRLYALRQRERRRLMELVSTAQAVKIGGCLRLSHAVALPDDTEGIAPGRRTATYPPS